MGNRDQIEGVWWVSWWLWDWLEESNSTSNPIDFEICTTPYTAKETRDVRWPAGIISSG